MSQATDWFTPDTFPRVTLKIHVLALVIISRMALGKSTGDLDRGELEKVAGLTNAIRISIATKWEREQDHRPTNWSQLVRGFRGRNLTAFDSLALVQGYRHKINGLKEEVVNTIWLEGYRWGEGETIDIELKKGLSKLDYGRYVDRTKRIKYAAGACIDYFTRYERDDKLGIPRENGIVPTPNNTPEAITEPFKTLLMGFAGGVPPKANPGAALIKEEFMEGDWESSASQMCWDPSN